MNMTMLLTNEGCNITEVAAFPSEDEVTTVLQENTLDSDAIQSTDNEAKNK